MAAKKVNPKGSSTSEPRQAEGPSRKRTAVLVFHGIGDQRPMETLNGVVDAVLGAPDPSGVQEPIQRWVRPYVGADGSFDLKSITTEPIRASNTRYDFFEFYWAPLMSGTRLVAVILWLCDLAKRDRDRLPRDAWWVWHVIVAILVGALMASVHLMWVVGLTLIGTDADALSARHEAAMIPIAAFFIVMGAAAAAFAVTRLGKSLTTAVMILGVAGILAFIGAWRGLALLTAIPVLVVLLMFFGRAAALYGLAWVSAVTLSIVFWGSVLTLIGIGSAATPPFDQRTAFDIVFLSIQFKPASVWLLGFLALFMALALIFLVPYVGDCARYLRDAPDNIEARNKIRALGLQVLDDLHKRLDRDNVTPRYDRIVIVAHSLGSVIAYDVLRAFYVKQTADLSLDASKQPALAAIHQLRSRRLVAVEAAAVRTPNGLVWKELARSDAPASPVAVAVGANARDLTEEASAGTGSGDATSASSDLVSTITFQDMQRGAFDGFVTGRTTPGGAPWRISDFVTMGSPLTHAALLLTQHGALEELAEKVADREFPVAPPVWSQHERGRVFYWSRPVRSGGTGNGELKLQHSSMFALTTWTNLYFTQRMAVMGDFIGGPITSDLSPGTLNVPLKTEVSGGFFNHTHYWNLSEGEGAAHIRALKLSVLGREACADVAQQRGLPPAGPAPAPAAPDLPVDKAKGATEEVPRP
jgi:hypothetical protein